MYSIERVIGQILLTLLIIAVFYLAGGKISKWMPNEPIKANLSSVIINLILMSAFNDGMQLLSLEKFMINCGIVAFATLFFNFMITATFDLKKSNWYLFPTINLFLVLSYILLS